jgi:hypothetical protein
MSYDIRNQRTATAQRTAELERLNFLALKSRLNKEYEDSQFRRKENERLDIEPAIPIYRSKDELLADLTTQRQLLKFNLQQVMDKENINKFLGYTFKSPDYAVLTNQYWEDIEPQVAQYKPLSAPFLYEWLNRYFYTKQKMGTDLDVVVDPDQFGDLYDVSMRTAHFVAPEELSDEEIKRAVREIVSRNYGFVINPYSEDKDDDIRQFYIQEKVIMPTKTLTPTHWRTIYEKEMKGFDDRLGSYLPATQFAYSGFKQGSELAPPSSVITPEETTERKRQVVPGTFVPAPPQGSKTAQEVALTPSGKVVPVPVEPTQQTRPAASFEDEMTRLLEESPSVETFQSMYNQVFNPKTGGDYYNKMRTFAKNQGYKNVPSGKDRLFVFLKQKLSGKLSPSMSNKPPTAYEKEFGFGNYYKFGKYGINKRGLKKKP